MEGVLEEMATPKKEQWEDHLQRDQKNQNKHWGNGGVLCAASRLPLPSIL